VTRKSVEQTIKKTVVEKKVIDYRKKIKEMAETDPEFVASKLKKWLKEK
jgi:flagellar biosynthesis/type III secretory pathway M-ring protein FliF/YscJ